MLSAKFSCQPNVPAILAFLFPIRLRPNEEWYEYRSKCSLHGVINGEAVAEVKLVRVGNVSLVSMHMSSTSQESSILGWLSSIDI